MNINATKKIQWCRFYRYDIHYLCDDDQCTRCLGFPKFPLNEPEGAYYMICNCKWCTLDQQVKKQAEATVQRYIDLYGKDGLDANDWDEVTRQVSRLSKVDWERIKLAVMQTTDTNVLTTETGQLSGDVTKDENTNHVQPDNAQQIDVAQVIAHIENHNKSGGSATSSWEHVAHFGMSSSSNTTNTDDSKFSMLSWHSFHDGCSSSNALGNGATENQE